MKNYYETLGVKSDATMEEIKKAYKILAKEFHPDINKDSNAENKFKEISEAYEFLSNEEKRKQYDYDFFNYKNNSQKNYNSSICKFCKKEVVFQESNEQLLFFFLLIFFFFPLGILYYFFFMEKRTCPYCKGKN